MIKSSCAIVLLTLASIFVNGQIYVEKHLCPGTGTSIVEGEDHNFIVTVNLYSGQFRVMKIDSSGSQIWSKIFGPTTGTNPNNVASNIIRVTSNKYLIIGTNDPGIGGYNKVYGILIDSAGNTIWERDYATNNSAGSSAVYDSVSNFIYIIGGLQLSDHDIYLVKIDTNGVLIWEKDIDLGSDDFASKIVLRNANDLWIIGGFVINNSTFDGMILNIDSSGNVNWMQHYGGIHDEGFSNIFLMDSGAIILGHTISFGSGNADAWILRTNEMGDTLWTRTYGNSTIDVPNDITFDSDHGYIWVVGHVTTFSTNQNQGWVFKMDTIGNIINSNLLGGTQNEYFYSTCYGSDNSLYAIGRTIGSGSWDTVYFVRHDSANLISKTAQIEIQNSLSAFPIPSNDQVYIKISENIGGTITDIELFNILDEHCTPQYERRNEGLIIQLPSMSGIYFLTLTVNCHKYYCKLIKT